MGRNRKSKRKKTNGSRNNPGQAFTRFCEGLFGVLMKYNAQEAFTLLTTEEKRWMYAFRCVVSVPRAAHGHQLPLQELKRIGRHFQIYLRTDTYLFGKVMLTPYEVQLLYSFVKVVKTFIKSESRRIFLQKQFPFIRFWDDLIDEVSILYQYNFLKVATSLSRVNYKHYMIDHRFAALVKDNPVFEMEPLVSQFPVQTKLIPINGIERPAFRLGAVYTKGEFHYDTIRATALGQHYKGRKESLEVYIQSHALNRLSERLDLLDEPAINYSLWINTDAVKGFKFYRGYLLLPFKLHGIKIGYLAANLVGDLVLFRTFLFITHSSTPEGDRLKEITGLEKNDISYWRLDRLSTLLQADAEKYPGLAALLDQAGMGEILHLRDKNLDLRSIQDANLECLMNYITQGQEARLEKTY